MKLSAPKVALWRTFFTSEGALATFDALTKVADTAELLDSELDALISLVEFKVGFPGDDLAALRSEYAARTFPKVYDSLDIEAEEQPASDGLAAIPPPPPM